MKISIENTNYTTLILDDDETNEVARIKINHETRETPFSVSFSDAEDYSLDEIVQMKKCFDKAEKIYKAGIK